MDSKSNNIAHFSQKDAGVILHKPLYGIKYCFSIHPFLKEIITVAPDNIHNIGIDLINSCEFLDVLYSLLWDEWVIDKLDLRILQKIIMKIKVKNDSKMIYIFFHYMQKVYPDIDLFDPGPIQEMKTMLEVMM
jgi:hypothetical protein